MAKDRTNIRNYGDDTTSVYVAPKGTTGPTGLEAPGAGWSELGWIGNDGVNLDRSMDTEDVLSIGGTLLKRQVTSMDDTIQVGCLEETAVALGLYYRGAAPTVAAGVAHIAVANQRVTDERAWIFDFFEGAIQKRFVVPAGEVTELDTLAHSKSNPTIYTFTVTLYGDYDIYSNAPALIAAGTP